MLSKNTRNFNYVIEFKIRIRSILINRVVSNEVLYKDKMLEIIQNFFVSVKDTISDLLNILLWL